MDLRLISRFLAVAETGSLNKAAKRLGISQPALSKSIQNFEFRLKVPLFNRSARGVTLTSFGEAIFDHARRISSEFNRLENNIEAIRTLSYAEINVGAPLGPDSRNLAVAILNMIRENRRLQINIINGTRDELIRPLLLGELDFLLTTLFDSHELPPLIEQQTLYLDAVSIIARHDHPLAGKNNIGIEEIRSFPWVALSGSHNTEAVLERLLGSKFKHSLVRSGSPMFVKNIVHRSDFIGLVRQDSVSIELRNKLLVELSLAPQINVTTLFSPQKVGIIFRKESPPSPGSQALIAQLKQSTAPNTTRNENPFLPATEL